MASLKAIVIVSAPGVAFSLERIAVNISGATPSSAVSETDPPASRPPMALPPASRSSVWPAPRSESAGRVYVIIGVAPVSPSGS